MSEDIREARIAVVPDNATEAEEILISMANEAINGYAEAGARRHMKEKERRKSEIQSREYGHLAGAFGGVDRSPSEVRGAWRRAHAEYESTKRAEEGAIQIYLSAEQRVEGTLRYVLTKLGKTRDKAEQLFWPGNG